MALTRPVVPPDGSSSFYNPLIFLRRAFGCVTGVSKIPSVSVGSWIACHGASGSDDYANVLAGLIWMLRDGARKQAIPMVGPILFKLASGHWSETIGSVPNGGGLLTSENASAPPGGWPLNQARERGIIS